MKGEKKVKKIAKTPKGKTAYDKIQKALKKVHDKEKA